jgi:N-acetylglucosaminyldiphosphoundecaprenol N-acetyl-beta-D-mannosaminyltransferase
VLGVPIEPLSNRELFEVIESHIRTRSRLFIATVGAEAIMMARRSGALGRILRDGSLNIADGSGVVVPYRLLYHKRIERLAGIDVFDRICERSAAAGWRIYLFGAEKGVLDEAIGRLRSRYPAIRIVGSRHGYFSADAVDDIVDDINVSEADVLFVALGMPRQEMWIDENLKRLRPPVLMGIGGTLDIVAGRLGRAPRSIQKAHLEWLYRLAQEPWRIRRQWVLIPFVLRVMLQRVRFGVEGTRSNGREDLYQP